MVNFEVAVAHAPIRREVVADAHVKAVLHLLSPTTSVHLVHAFGLVSVFPQYPEAQIATVWSVAALQVTAAPALAIAVQAWHSLLQSNHVPYGQVATQVSLDCGAIVQVVVAADPFTLWKPLPHATTCELEAEEHVSAEAPAAKVSDDLLQMHPSPPPPAEQDLAGSCLLNLECHLPYELHHIQYEG